MRYDHESIEAKWQQRWESERPYATPTDRTKEKYYVLDMFRTRPGLDCMSGTPRAMSRPMRWRAPNE